MNKKQAAKEQDDEDEGNKNDEEKNKKRITNSYNILIKTHKFTKIRRRQKETRTSKAKEMSNNKKKLGEDER